LRIRKMYGFHFDSLLHSNENQCFNLLKPKLVYVIFKSSVRTSKRTPYFTITKIKWLVLSDELIPVSTEYHAECKSKLLLKQVVNIITVPLLKVKQL
jgi:hypothetical protein